MSSNRKYAQKRDLLHSISNNFDSTQLPLDKITNLFKMTTCLLCDNQSNMANSTRL